MKSNFETDESIIAVQTKLRRNQFDLRVEQALAQKQTASSSTTSASTSSGTSGGTVGGGGAVGGGETGGGVVPCFTGETLFTLWSGVSITFAELFENRTRFIGRFALSYNDDNTPVRGLLTHVMKTIVYDYLEVSFSDGSVDGVRPMHRYWTKKGWQEIFSLIGKEVFTSSGDWVKVTNIKFVETSAGIAVYNATIRTFANYTANNKKVHNNKRNPDDPFIV